MKLDGKLDEILDLFSNGERFRSVAEKMQVSTRTLHKFLSKDENYKKYMLVLRESGDVYADKAEEILLTAPSDKIEIQRARELAQHYRWLSSKRNPKKYGDKLDVTSDNEKINNTDTTNTLLGELLKKFQNK